MTKAAIAAHYREQGAPWHVRFWSKVLVVEGPNACWLWLANRDQDGYGMLKIDGRCKRATHISLLTQGIEVPKGAMVMHICDTPSCVRPDHLRIGDAKLNRLDSITKGRVKFKRGESSPVAKLTEAEVLAIRAMYIPRKMSESMLAERFGVNRASIGMIVRREIWKHI